MQPQTATLGNKAATKHDATNAIDHNNTREQGSHNARRDTRNQNGNTREQAAATHDATNATKTATLGNKAATIGALAQAVADAISAAKADLTVVEPPGNSSLPLARAPH